MKYIDRTVISKYEPKTTDVMWVFPTENGETELRTFVNGKWKAVGDDSDAYRKPQDGIPESDLSSDVQEAINAAKPNVLISTIHIEQGITDDFIQITGDIAVNKNASGNIIYRSTFGSNNEFGIPSHKSANENVFSWIRENTKCVYGKWDKDYKFFKYIKKENIDVGYDEIGGLTGAFIIIPAFYWKCDNIDANHSTVKVAKDYPGEGWNYYDGKYAIPQYKFSTNTDLTNNKKTSVDDGVSIYDMLIASTPTANISMGERKPAIYISQQAGVGLSRTIGEGWSLINYELHGIMTLLCLGYYGRIDVRNYIGKAEDNENQYHYKMLDNIPYICDTIGSVNPDNTVLWGICDWYNNVFEWMDDLMNLGQVNYLEDADAFNYVNGVGVVDTTLRYNSSNYHYYLDKKIKRVITAYSDDDNDGYFGSNAILGEYFDLMSSKNSEVVSEDNDIYGWSCYFGANGGTGYVAGRACSFCYSDAGLAYLSVGHGAGRAVGDCGLRLLYHGDMLEVTNEDNF